jgi:hypothetical protein
MGQTPELPKLTTLFIEDRNGPPLPPRRGASSVESFWEAISGYSSPRYAILPPNSAEPQLHCSYTRYTIDPLPMQVGAPTTNPSGTITNRHWVAAITIQIKSRGYPSK